jgi:pimeloyl-ACP methyl ester carboxylesterase
MKQFKCFAVILFLTVLSILVHAGEAKPAVGTVKSNDGVPIYYQVSGKGEPALVFVHCWCCDRTYWNKQVPYFSKNYKVVTIDLAGHGASGLDRKEWTTQAFGQDVAAVVKKLDLKKVILLGHSMGGGVIAAAALLIPKRVIGLIGVDTFNTIEQKFTREQFDQFLAPLRADFVKGTQNFIRSIMFYPDADPALVDKIANDMASAPPEVGLGAMEAMFNLDLPVLLDKVKVPVYCVNSDKFPIDIEAGKRHTVSFKVKIMPKVGHFLMMEDPKTFNQLLDETLKELTQTQ